MTTAGSICLALSACLMVGCSSRPKTVIVGGTVTLDGRGLDAAVIRFMPLPETAAPASGSLIRRGRYLAAARGGLVPGRYRVEIDSQPTGKPEPAAPDDEAPSTPRPPPIPSAYNLESRLEIVVAATPPQQVFDFNLRSEVD